MIAVLGDCVELIRDSTLPEQNDGLPYVGLEHIAQDSLQLVGHGWASDVTSSKTRFRQGDILFGKLRPYFRKVVRAPFDGICSTDIWVLRAKEGADQEFMRYCMSTRSFIDFAVAGSEGTRMPRAKWEFVSQYAMQVPRLREQRTIARILGALDDKVELNQRTNATLEAMARELFTSWFVDFDPVRRPSVRNEHPLPAEVRNLFPKALGTDGTPAGWSIRALDEIADFLNGLALQKYPVVDTQDSLPAIKIAELRHGVTPTSSRTSTEVPERYVVDSGDFLFSWSGTLMARFWTGGKGALNQHLFKVTSSRYPKWFFSHWVYHHLEHFRQVAASKATTMGHIQRHHLHEAMVNCPPDATIAKLGPIIAPMVEGAIGAALQSQKIASIRDALLPKLVSGRIGPHDAAHILDAAS